MKVIVLGAGLLGVTTAYELGKRGFDVTVLERRPGCGAETSFANGGQLSYSHAEPWASPGVLPKLPKWLIDPESPLVFRLRPDWQMIKWGLGFFRNCTPERARTNCITILRLGLYSRKRMEIIRRDTGIAFDYDSRGILHIFGTEKDFDHAKAQSEFQAKFGDEERIVSREECFTLEPALAHTSRQIAGGIHAFRDESGDAHLYCKELSAVAARHHGVTFRYGVTVRQLLVENNRVVGVRTSEGDISADGYVMAMGSYSPIFLRKIGIDIPVYPMKGYSVTVAANDFCPNLSITDGTHKIVFSRLGKNLRVAGTAEFAGYNDKINEKRIAPIVHAARGLFPKADWDGEMGKWACLRPQTPAGPPVMGPTPYPNLFLNTGHGTLGWTQAAGSAAVVADIMEGKNPEIMLHGLVLGRR